MTEDNGADLDIQPSEPVVEESGDAVPDDESTVGVGSAMAVGCSLIVFLILLGGICLFVYRQVS